MKTLLNISVLTFVLTVAPNLCSAMVSIAEMTKARAKEMGVTFRSNMAGTNEVHFWLEFKAAGALKDFRHASVEFRDGDRLRLHAVVQTERTQAGNVLVHFCADREVMPACAVRLLITHGERTHIGYDFRMKDFIQWSDDEIAGLSLELTDSERVESLQFKPGGRVLATLGSKAAVTAPIWQWKLVEGRLQILNGDKLHEELTLVSRDDKTLNALRRDRTLASYKTVGK